MKLINIHTHKSTGNPKVLEIVNLYPTFFVETEGYFSIGIKIWLSVKDMKQNRINNIPKRQKKWEKRENASSRRELEKTRVKLEFFVSEDEGLGELPAAMAGRVATNNRPNISYA